MILHCVRVTLLLAIAAWIVAASDVAARAATVYAAPEGYPASDRFRVTVDGQLSHVYRAEVAAEQEFQKWPHPMQRVAVGFTYFDMDGPATVQIQVLGEAPKDVRVRPRSKNIAAQLDGNVVQLQLPKPGNYVVELNQNVYDHLYLFANPPEKDRPNPADPNVTYFGTGVHEIGRLQFDRDGQTVYIAGGAVVRGCLWPKDVEGFKVCGRGLLVGTGLSRGSNMIRPRNCTDVRIEDITIVDAPCWTIRLDSCRNVRIRNVRQLSFMQNSDGIDPCSSEDIEIENVFIRSYDDGVVVKAMRDDGPSRNIRTLRSTFLTDHGTSLKVGNNETLGPPVSDVVFEDCDVLSCRGTPLGLFFNGPSCVSNVRFQNIRVERSRVNPMKVRHDGGVPTPRFIFCAIAMGNAYLSNYTPGFLREVTFRDVHYLSSDTDPAASIRLEGHSEASSISEVTLENVSINGTLVSSPEHPAVVLGDFVYNVHFASSAENTAVTARRRTLLLPEPQQPDEPPLPPAEPVVSNSGDILIEAETGQLGRAMKRWSNDPSASGRWYIMPMERSNSQKQPPGPEGHASFDFSLERPGTYGLQALVGAPTQDDNSFWVRIDDRPWIQWTAIPPLDVWQWCDVRDAGEHHRSVELDLSAGKHRLVFAYREDGTMLDRVALRKR